MQPRRECRGGSTSWALAVDPVIPFSLLWVWSCFLHTLTASQKTCQQLHHQGGIQSGPTIQVRDSTTGVRRPTFQYWQSMKKFGLLLSSATKATGWEPDPFLLYWHLQAILLFQVLRQVLRKLIELTAKLKLKGFGAHRKYWKKWIPVTVLEVVPVSCGIKHEHFFEGCCSLLRNDRRLQAR